MTVIGVISDTHMPSRARVLPETLVESLKNVDIIIHAGDIKKDYIIYELEELAPVYAVAGNTDDGYMESLFGRKKIIDVEQCRIGVTHGDAGSGTTLDRAKKAFADESIHCVIFGHSHIPFNEIIDGILYFNPGSPTDKRRQVRFTYGIIQVDGDKVTGEIKYI